MRVWDKKRLGSVLLDVWRHFKMVFLNHIPGPGAVTGAIQVPGGAATAARARSSFVREIEKNSARKNVA